MSTLKVTNIQDTSGGNNSTSEEIFEGRCKAWVNFNGNGTVAARDNFNANSITDNGTGEYRINFDSALPNANYCMVGMVLDANGYGGNEATTRGGNNIAIDAATAPTTSSFGVRTFYGASANANGGLTNDGAICVAVFS